MKKALFITALATLSLIFTIGSVSATAMTPRHDVIIGATATLTGTESSNMAAVNAMTATQIDENIISTSKDVISAAIDRVRVQVTVTGMMFPTHLYLNSSPTPADYTCFGRISGINEMSRFSRSLITPGANDAVYLNNDASLCGLNNSLLGSRPDMDTFRSLLLVTCPANIVVISGREFPLRL